MTVYTCPECGSSALANHQRTCSHPKFTVTDDVITGDGIDRLGSITQAMLRSYEDDYLRRESDELRHLVRYPGATTYGRHANDGGPDRPLVKDVHYLVVGGEYPGRHRHTGWLRSGMVFRSKFGQWLRLGEHAGDPSEVVG